MAIEEKTGTAQPQQDEKEKLKSEMFDKLTNEFRVSEVATQNDTVETEFVVRRPNSGEILCYCKSKEHAMLIDNSLKLAFKMSMGYLVNKLFI